MSLDLLTPSQSVDIIDVIKKLEVEVAGYALLITVSVLARQLIRVLVP